MAKRYNPRRAKTHHSYTVEEAAVLYGVHPQTVRSWTRKGLHILTGSVPHLILGGDLRAYIESIAQTKRPLGPNEFYCARCRAGVEPWGGLADYVPRTDTQGRLSALCGRCEGPVNRFASPARLSVVAPDLDLTVRGPREDLYDPAPHHSNAQQEA